jgi:resuscitation-promoting factor RpfA
MHKGSTAPSCASGKPDIASTRRRRGVATLAGTLGVAAVVSAVAPAPADAFSRSVGTVWDRVAGCESSGRWHINTGNGYYGGLQFSYRTWVGYHGRKYAPRADRATRAQQIEVARRVLAVQGRNAWPVCGPEAGLTKSSGGATRAPLPNVAG